MENENYQITQFGGSSSSLRKLRQMFQTWVNKMPSIRQDGKYSPQENQESKPTKTETANSDAVFLGWQKLSSGEEFALYNVLVKEHPLYRSTVSEQTLRSQNLLIPNTPSSSSDEK